MTKDQIEKYKYTEHLREKPLFCPRCQTSRTSLVKRGMAGCPYCYDIFRTEIQQILMEYRLMNETVRS